MTFEKRPLPGVGDGGILMSIEAVLTCGTDLKAYRRGHPIIPLPMTLGHEYAGRVVAAGPAVTGFREGDRVATVHSGPCLACPACRRGRENLCDSITREMAWGGYAEYVSLPARVHRSNMIKIPDALTFERAAFLEPVACVLHGIKSLDISRVETAVVLGAGPMGLLFVELLGKAGVPRIVVCGKRAQRLERARRLGAHVVVDVASDSARDAVRDLTKDQGADAVVECVGRIEAWQLAIDLVSKGGQVLFYGGCPADARLSVDTRRLHYNEITLKGTFHFTREDVREAFALIRDTKIDVDALVSGRYTLPELPEAFARLMDGDGIKYVIASEST
jgi:L-iditol 2-dehydrogenase